MTVKIPGYSTVSGKPQAILRLLKDAQIFEGLKDHYTAKQADAVLREMNKSQKVIIEEEK